MLSSISIAQKWYSGKGGSGMLNEDEITFSRLGITDLILIGQGQTS
jgi:hypothetical protein